MSQQRKSIPSHSIGSWQTPSHVLRKRDELCGSDTRISDSDELLHLIRDAWAQIKPKIDRDPRELARRLARRSQGMMNQPVRAWCLAVRAADTRINPATARIVPEEAGYPFSHRPGVEREYREHTVTLDAPLLRKLCAPVYCDKPYNTYEQIMAKLGCSLHNLKFAIAHGVLMKWGIPHLGGKVGPPVPVVYTDRPLDPGSRLREHADPLWGTTWRMVNEHIPDDLEQTIRRVPSIVYIKPQAATHMEGDVFNGWKWVCPGCGKTCRTIFYPLPPLYWVQLLEKEFHDRDEAHPDALSRGIGAFGCLDCHKVLYHSRLNRKSWNGLISHLSAGLLYGFEVKKPRWYEEQRKREFAPQLRRAPSKRREEVLELLQRGMSYPEIARELGVSKSTVNARARELYRMKGIKGGLKELRKKVDPSTSLTSSSQGVAVGCVEAD